MTIPSPCTHVCRMSAQTGWCEGCYRTLDEITHWATADDAYKQRVWAEIDQRQHPVACIRQPALTDSANMRHRDQPEALAQHLISSSQVLAQDFSDATNEPSPPLPPPAQSQ